MERKKDKEDAHLKEEEAAKKKADEKSASEAAAETEAGVKADTVEVKAATTEKTAE